jgi:hypothetical protein
MLTDKEKLIISTLIINKQQMYVMGEYKRADLLREYGKAFEIESFQNFFSDLILEERHFKQVLENEFRGLGFTFLDVVSNLTNHERLIFYSTELMLVQALPFDVHAKLKNMVMKSVNIDNDDEETKEIQEQSKQTFKFITFMLKNNNV